MIQFGPGTVRVNTAGTLNNPGPGVYIQGAGLWATTVMFHGTGDLFRVWNPNYLTATVFGGGITGLMLDGTSAGAGSAGLHAGDLLQYRIDIGVRHWNGTGSKGVHFDNQVIQTEQVIGRIWAQNCAAHVVFDVAPGAAPGASGSFDRAILAIFIDQQNAGDGVVFQNGAYMVNGALAVFGNFSNSAAANSYAVLRLTGQTPSGVTGVSYSNIQKCRLDIGVECDNALAHAPQTVNVGGANNGVTNCYGILDFSSGAPFAASNIGSGLYDFFGPVAGDSTLATATLTNSLNVLGIFQALGAAFFVSNTGAGDVNFTLNAGSGGAAWFNQNSNNAGFLGHTGNASGNKLWHLCNIGDTGFNVYTNSNGGSGATLAKALSIGFDQNTSLNGHKLTNVANGSAGTDGVAYGQLGSAAFQASSAFDAAGAAAAVASNLAAEVTRAETAEALLAPKASPTFTGTVTVPSTVNATDPAQKQYVDSVAAGLDAKPSVTALASSNITLSGTQTIDGVAVTAGQRVLATGQSTASQNGLWVVAAGSWTRPADFASGSTQLGAFVFAEAGTAYGSSGWVLVGASAVTVDTSSQTWTQFSGAGEINAGTGLSKSGNTLSNTGVLSAAAADTSVVVGGTASAPTFRTGTLDVVATQHPPVASVSMNSQKFTGLANGSAATDSAAYGQTPAGGSTVTIGQGGTGQVTAAAAYNALSPMTAKGDMEYDSAAGTAARLPVGSAGQVLGVSAAVPAWLMGLTPLATTGAAGYALVNGTGTVISWTVPNDGQLHRFIVIANKIVASPETGGIIQVSFTDLTSVARNLSIFSGGQAAGFQATTAVQVCLVFAQAGSTVSIKQTSALSAGASTLWCEIWGS